MSSRVLVIVGIMVVYLIIMLVIGIRGRKYSASNKDVMTAAGQGTMLLVVGSYLGSHLGNGVVVGGAQNGAMYGIGGLWYGAGSAFSYLLFAVVLAKLIYKKGYLTLPDILAEHYGDKVTAVLIAVLHCGAMIGMIAGQIIAGKLLFEYIGLPGTLGAMITLLIVICYCAMSGLWGVMMTDVIQTSVILVVTVVSIFWIMSQGGFDMMSSVLPASSYELVPFDAETMIMMFGPGMLYGLISALSYQRTVSCKEEKTARLAPVIAGVIILGFAVLPVLIGMYGRALWPEAEASTIIFKVLMEQFPPVLGGLMVACICAAVMSTCDGQLLAGSANIVNDIYLKVINPDGHSDEKKLTRLTTISTVVMGIIAMLISLSFTMMVPLLSLCYSLLNSGALVMVMGAIFWKKSTKEGAIASFVVGVGLTLLNYFGVIAMPYASVLPLVPAAIVFVIVSLMTQPKEQAAV